MIVTEKEMAMSHRHRREEKAKDDRIQKQKTCSHEWVWACSGHNDDAYDCRKCGATKWEWIMVKWAEEGENSLWLFSINEYELLPDGIELESIGGTKKTKGIDYIDLDTRGGHIAWGIRSPETHKHKDLFLIFLLKKKYVWLYNV